MAFIQSTGKETTSNETVHTLAFVSNVTAGSLILVKCRIGTTSVTATCTDSLGNTYQTNPIDTDDGVNGFHLTVGYAMNSAAGANTVTVTLNTGATMRWTIEEYGNVLTSGALDKTAVALGSSASPDSGNTATTTAANELISGAVALTVGGATTISLGSGFSNLQVAPAAPSSKVGAEGKAVGATGTYNATFSLGASGAWICAVCTFKLISSEIVTALPFMTSCESRRF